MRWQFILSALLLVLFTGRPAWPCRPIRTEDCGITPDGKISAEFGLESAVDRSDNRANAICAALNYGLAGNMSTGLELPYIMLDAKSGSSESGLGDIMVKLKYRFVEETGSGPSMMAKFNLTLPTGDEDAGLGSGKSNFVPHFVMTKTWDKITVYFDAAYAFMDLPKSDSRTIWQDNQAFIGLGVQQMLSDKFGLLGELTYEPNFNGINNDESADTIIGLIYKLNDKTVFDLALRKGLTDVSPEYAVIAGVSMDF